MTDEMDALAEKVVLARWERGSVYKMGRRSFDKLPKRVQRHMIDEQIADLKRLTALGYRLAPPGSVVVPRDVLEDLLAFYEIDDDAHVPGSDAFITRHRADLALNPDTMIAAAGGNDG